MKKVAPFLADKDLKIKAVYTIFNFQLPLGKKSTDARGSSHEHTIDCTSFEVLFTSQEDGPFYFTKYNFISGDFYTKYFESI